VVVEIVGHSAIEMTVNIYVHGSLDNQCGALDLLNAQLVVDDEDTR
jgi:integrase